MGRECAPIRMCTSCPRPLPLPLPLSPRLLSQVDATTGKTTIDKESMESDAKLRE